MATTSPEVALAADSKDSTAPNTDMVSSTTPSMTSSADAKCYLLDDMPAEIRNHIYSLALAPVMSGPPVELLECAPPSKSILLICRQIRDEAIGIYQAHRRSYWTQNDFQITLSEGQEALNKEEIEVCMANCSFIKTMLSDVEIMHITKLSLRFWDSDFDFTCALTFTDGEWNSNSPGPQSQTSKFILVHKDKLEALCNANLNMTDHQRLELRRTERSWVTILLLSWTPDEIARAKEIAGKSVLTKSELMVVMRGVVRLGDDDDD